MKFIPVSVTRTISRQVLVAQKNSPTILFAAGVTGVITSTVLACRATLKMDEIISDVETKREMADRAARDFPAQYPERDYQQDLKVLKVQTAITVTKLYAPAIIIGTLSIAALAGSHNILSKRNAALTAAYAALDQGFREYRQRVEDEYGEDKEREFRYGITTDTIREQTEKGSKKSVVTRFGDGRSPYGRLFNEANKHWTGIPEYDYAFLRGQQMMATDMLRSRGHLFLNEVYDNLGYPRTKAGAVVGWVREGGGDGYVDFGIFDGENFDGVYDFMRGLEGELLLDFNVDGVIYDRI